MKKIILAILLFSLFFACGAKAQTSSGWLHTDGNQIKDANGNIYKMRGVNIYTCLKNEQAKYTNAAALGINTVRIPFWKNQVDGVPSGPCVGKNGLTELDTSIQYAKNAGLKVILDQQYWAPNVSPATNAFFTDAALQESWLVMWETLIARYQNNDAVIGIDLMNEPWSIANRPANAQALWEGIAKNAYTRLHPQNPNLIIFVASWGAQTQPAWSDMGWFVDTANVAITDHVYGQKTFEYLQIRYNYFTSAGVPVWLGEIGFNTGEDNFMLAQLQNIDALGLHYTLFAYGTDYWALSFDIVNSTYQLNSRGIIYRDYLAGLVPMTLTHTETPTPTPTNTATPTYTPTYTSTYTPTPTPTSTATVTNTATNTPTKTRTPTPECKTIRWNDGSTQKVCKGQICR